VDAVVGLLVFVVLLAAVAVVVAPLRRGHADRVVDREQGQRDELEAAKEAKYLEIRDAEMDFRTGKLSEADYKALDRQLRSEAVDILRDIDALD
jgi:flagellar biosynthesis/type III secretory pathway M-ring protein FliF/YscJ